MIELSAIDIQVELCEPGTFYRGTRFDWNGVFRSVSKAGTVYADKWFDGDDPLRHDNLCGFSEEFAPVWLPDGRCLKPGVGILRGCSPQSYDRFKLYEITDVGTRSVKVDDRSAVFIHGIDGLVSYEKTVAIHCDGCMVIAHKLKNISQEMIRTDCYNHNFITFGKDAVGKDRAIRFPRPVSGSWRSDSTPKAVFDSSGIGFTAGLKAGEVAFIGDLHYEEGRDEGYEFTVRDGMKEVLVESDAPMDHAVFWSNHRVACVEPYVKVELVPEQEKEWTIKYRFI